jgi:hypothetical protein
MHLYATSLTCPCASALLFLLLLLLLLLKPVTNNTKGRDTAFRAHMQVQMLRSSMQYCFSKGCMMQQWLAKMDANL